MLDEEDGEADEFAVVVTSTEAAVDVTATCDKEAVSEVAEIFLVTVKPEKLNIDCGTFKSDCALARSNLCTFPPLLCFSCKALAACLSLDFIKLMWFTDFL